MLVLIYCHLGAELVSNPSILFLDEPTSGLDSFTAQNTIELLKNIAQKHKKTIICTLHQPRSNIFEILDMLCVMTKGCIVYFGEAQNSVTHFQKLGMDCPRYSNPADYFIDICSIDRRNPESLQLTENRVDDLILGYQKSRTFRKNQKYIKEIVEEESNQDIKISKGHATNFFVQSLALSGRSWKSLVRDKVT